MTFVSSKTPAMGGTLIRLGIEEGGHATLALDEGWVHLGAQQSVDLISDWIRALTHISQSITDSFPDCHPMANAALSPVEVD